MKHLLLLLTVTLLLAPDARGQIHEVRQTVFGMDCAPCAYGLEKRFKKMSGVADATVSLNEGYALVNLEADNTLALDDIQAAVRDGGFSPRGLSLRATGTLSEADGTWTLSLPSGDRFTVRLDPEAFSKSPQPGEATIAGRIEEGSDTLHLTGIESGDAQ